MNKDEAWDRLIPAIMVLNDLDMRALELHDKSGGNVGLMYDPEQLFAFALHRELMSWYSKLDHALSEARDLIASANPESDVSHWKRMVEVQLATRREAIE